MHLHFAKPCKVHCILKAKVTRVFKGLMVVCSSDELFVTSVVVA